MVESCGDAGPVRFSLKLSAVITLIILILVATGALIGAPVLREKYLSALRNTLVAQVDGIVKLQERDQKDLAVALDRIVRSSRLVAAINNKDKFRQNAEDELRYLLDRGGPRSSFFFMVENDYFTGRDEVSSFKAFKELAPLLKRISTVPITEPFSLFWPFDGEVFQFMLSPMIDSDGYLGLLVFYFPYSKIDPMIMSDKSLLQVGLRIEDGLYGFSLNEAEKATAEIALKSSGGALEKEFTMDSQKQIAYTHSIVKEPPTELVAITSLAPLYAAESALFWRMVFVAAIALCVGLVMTLYLAHTLSRPIADMTIAARAIQAGDYSIRVPVRDRGELGALSQRFNEMGEGLALRDQYRRVLDVVADPEVAKELLAGKIDLTGRSLDVGILFCDIRGFTSLTENMPPQRVIEFLNSHMSVMTKVAYEHGGVVDKFVGDMIMVTFGAPKPSSNDAQRMAKCAQAMIQARRAANDASSIPIQIGIGCAFGTVVAGCMGSEQRLDYTVLGAVVNLAARLCSMAPPMKVYIDTETNTRNQSATSVALDPLKVKGFSYPILAFELE